MPRDYQWTSAYILKAAAELNPLSANVDIRMSCVFRGHFIRKDTAGSGLCRLEQGGLVLNLLIHGYNQVPNFKVREVVGFILIYIPQINPGVVFCIVSLRRINN